MDELFWCPDCGTTHDEPFEPALGHVARCFGCALEAALAAWAEPDPHYEQPLAA